MVCNLPVCDGGYLLFLVRLQESMDFDCQHCLGIGKLLHDYVCRCRRYYFAALEFGGRLSWLAFFRDRTSDSAEIRTSVYAELGG